MNDNFGYELALRAPNLAERVLVLRALKREGITTPAGVALSPLDSWKSARLAARLGSRQVDDTFLGEDISPDREAEYLEVLRTYRGWELGQDCSDTSVRKILDEVHGSWLPWYVTAIQEFDPARPAVLNGQWRLPETYSGRFARVCEPFLATLQEQIAGALAGLAPEQQTLFGPNFGDGFVDYYLQRFELTLAWAQEADQNVFRALKGIPKDSVRPEDYSAYLDHNFASPQAYHSFYLRFPTLARWLSQVLGLCSENARRVINRLASDAPEISRVIFGGSKVRFKALSLGTGDPHAGCQTVARVAADVDGRDGEFFYKPRSLEPERATQTMLCRLGAATGVAFPHRSLIVGEGYGYEELLPSGRNRVRTTEEAERIYEELGGYLALFYVLGGTDLHFENIVVADGHAHLCDCEMVLEVRPAGEKLGAETLLDSVFRTGLLEWPRTDPSISLKLSGYAGGESFSVPYRLPRVNELRESFGLAVKHLSGVAFQTDGANRVYLGDRLLPPEEFKSSIIRGFECVYRWFEDNKEQASRQVHELFGPIPIRYVNWATRIYSHLLTNLRHPKSLMDPVEADAIIRQLSRFRRRWDKPGLLANREIASLWQLDIPLFLVSATQLTLATDSQGAEVHLATSPIEDAVDRIGRLSAANREQQVRYIVASLPGDDHHSEEFAQSSVDYAGRVGRALCSAQTEPGSGTWRAYELTDVGPARVDVGTDLYGGSAGIALFFAYLNSLVPDPTFQDASRRALEHCLGNYNPYRIGAFNGMGGLVYVLTHLSRLGEDASLVEMATNLAERINYLLPEDREFDVLGGCAGLIPVMLGLEQVVPGGPGLKIALRCGDHLLRHGEDRFGGLSWPLRNPEEGLGNLTGYSHGSGGIGWSLLLLGKFTGKQEYTEAGRSAFAHENSYFDDAEQDWYDLRTSIAPRTGGKRSFANAWCNGSTGIGLSRLSGWALLGKTDDQMLKEAYQAVAASLRSLGTLGNDTLCHGKAGSAELFLRVGMVRGEPAFQVEANTQAQALWRAFERDGTLVAGSLNERIPPGLMMGLAGFGMHFLRLGHPERVPSPLLLDPVPGKEFYAGFEAAGEADAADGKSGADVMVGR